MNIEQISVRGREARVYHSADGLSELIEPFAKQISDATTASGFTKTLTKVQVAELIRLSMFTLILEADTKKLLAHASITPIKRRKPTSMIGAWGSNEPGFGRVVMELTAARAEGSVYALVHVRNGPAKNAMKNLGARKIWIKRSKETGNFVFVYKVTPKSRRRPI